MRKQEQKKNGGFIYKGKQWTIETREWSWQDDQHNRNQWLLLTYAGKKDLNYFLLILMTVFVGR